ncbi:MAG: single-stranded DNA-binding protein [Calditrichaeota bacterium]|nr:MAG: single-stranded DNA-binding protein [Calditrichota bacterium]
MARGTVNRAILIGRLGSDPDVRYTPSGTPVANFNIATNRVWKDRDGNPQEETTWHRIVVWGRTAEVVKEYARKGSRIFVEGRIQNREWEDQNGQRRYTTEIVASEIQFLDSPAGEGGGSQRTVETPDLEPPETLDTEGGEDVPF